ncbi:helix-turn-helix transcriptional regulator [Streptomyces sp. NPDC050439]|uniref:helix-turn-helix domain-containing protein n=1 Tax=unclassified Streptomyces TaxID=2593676 RepID=UPI003441B886
MTSESTYYVDGPLLRRLMQRIGTGQKITVRQLADATGLATGTIGALLSGTQRTLTEGKARRIASTIGVDLDILFIPCERAGRAALLQHAAATAVPV